MMRTIWLTLCCILVSMTNVQARDSGFNPFNVMDDMFDSSDDRRHWRRHRPPPPPPPPFAGYGRPPVPAAAPTARQQGAPYQPGRPGWGYQPRQPAAPAAAPQSQASSSPGLAPARVEAEPAPVQQPVAPRTQPRATSNEKAVITRGEGDAILINGRPAVFRPMGLGDDGASQ
jgi:hypothetical protein